MNEFINVHTITECEQVIISYTCADSCNGVSIKIKMFFLLYVARYDQFDAIKYIFYNAFASVSARRISARHLHASNERLAPGSIQHFLHPVRSARYGRWRTFCIRRSNSCWQWNDCGIRRKNEKEKKINSISRSGSNENGKQRTRKECAKYTKCEFIFANRSRSECIALAYNAGWSITAPYTFNPVPCAEPGLFDRAQPTTCRWQHDRRLCPRIQSRMNLYIKYARWWKCNGCENARK